MPDHGRTSGAGTPDGVGRQLRPVQLGEDGGLEGACEPSDEAPVEPVVSIGPVSHSHVVSDKGSDLGRDDGMGHAFSEIGTDEGTDPYSVPESDVARHRGGDGESQIGGGLFEGCELRIALLGREPRGRKEGGGGVGHARESRFSRAT
jgi:hypothetical protein